MVADAAIVSDTADSSMNVEEDGMSTRAGGVIRPGDADAEMASRAARRIRDYLTAHPGTDPVRIRGELAGDDTLIVPRAATVMLAQILALLASGQGVQIIPDAAELTTQQAADFLNVSRPYLIGLLEADEIPYRMVGTHRRIRFEDLREYRRRDDLKRRQAADQLTQLSEELGLY
jgi:excisionase family DNA binding protein